MDEPGAASGRRRRGRLSRSVEFDRVVRRGRSYSNRHMILHAFERQDGGEPRLGLSVSRKVGGAVDRNRVKRLLREAFREADAGPSAPTGHDVVVVARPELGELAEREGLRGVREALEDVLARLHERGSGR